MGCELHKQFPFLLALSVVVQPQCVEEGGVSFGQEAKRTLDALCQSRIGFSLILMSVEMQFLTKRHQNYV